jgi:hypothetical protein
LKDITAELSAELKTAKSKLSEKELEISRLRLSAAEKELELNREIQKLSLKLDDAFKMLGSKANEIPEPELPPLTKAAVAKQVTVDEPDVISILKDRADKANSVQAMTPGRNATSRGVKGVKSPAKTTISPKKKRKAAAPVSAKIATTKKAPTKSTSSASDLTSLSKSTLSRKTVKELTGFLVEKVSLSPIASRALLTPFSVYA